MKRFNKVIVAFLMMVVMSIMVLPVSAAGGEISSFGVDFIMEGSDYKYSTYWWRSEDETEKVYYVSVPHDAVDFYVDLTANGAVYLDGQLVKDGQPIAVEIGKTYILECGSESYEVVFLKGSDIPQMFITTTEPMDLSKKSNKRKGEIAIIDSEGQFEYNGALSEIKGRGNYTWNLPKKPFNIKLDEKTDLFGLGKSKKFSLLANYIDISMVKNKLVCDLAEKVGIDFSSKSEFVDLYINGEYYGNYTLIERVEIAENRVDIYNLEKRNEEVNENIAPEDAPLADVRGEDSASMYGTYKYAELENNPEEITGGYLLEYELPERYDDEASGFVSNYGQPIIVKSPEFASKEQVEYISDYYQQFENAVLSDDGKNDLGKHYSEYMDMESMAKMYVLQEFVKNLDSAITSFYLYKDVGGKLVAAPVWDFDSSLGRPLSRYGQSMADPEGVWATSLPIYSLEDEGKLTIIALLCKHAEFRQLAAEIWEELYAPEIENLLANVESMTSRISESVVSDKRRWTGSLENLRHPEETLQGLTGMELSEVAFDKAVEDLKDFISVRREFVSRLFDVDNNYVQYCANGANGTMNDFGVYVDGDALYVPGCGFVHPDETKTFLGWNTKANGWGVQYNPEETIIMEDSVVLYAQWEQPNLIGRIARFFAGLFN